MGRLSSLLLALSLAVPLLGGCSAELGEVPFLCNKGTPKCPDGYECKDELYCVKEGTCPASVPGCQATGECGDGTCDPGENTVSCPDDCPASSCGNGTCDLDETATSCPADCTISTCGDKICAAGETPKNCPGDCPPVCGDGSCDPGETGQSCPKDCGGTSCGNKVCEPGETATSCPADCSSACSGDATQCEGNDQLQTCLAGSWKTETCESICKTAGSDYAAGCKFDSTKGKDTCLCGKYVAFGGLCDDIKKCNPATLFCGVFGSASKGFCTKYCTSSSGCSGAPSGTYATCSLNVSGKTACGFECDFFTFCPVSLTCDFMDDLCKP